MTEAAFDLPDSISETIRTRAVELTHISPQFNELLRDLEAGEALELFRPLETALLPDGTERWVPSCGSDDLATCMRHLRLCKRRGLRHLIWWEMGLVGDMDASCRAIADFATGLLQQALSMAERLLFPRYGRLQDGRFCVIGLGKLGGRELNLGSDVDPLFVWDGGGETAGGRQAIGASEYYGHLSRLLIRLMSERTADGLVWPVDMRLRPGGDGAPICLSLEATLEHYQQYGQTWERAMLIKARPVAGDPALGEAFINELAPFIYRRYLDYTTVAALAEMKRRIDAQAGRQPIGEGFDVKRGKGGIREIEFIIQSMQLLHGGRNPALRLQPSMAALAKLADEGLIGCADADELASAYRFWRRIEHAVQARSGEQTHKLPADYDIYLAAATGIADATARMHEQADRIGRFFARQVLPIEEESGAGWLHGGHAESLDVLDEEGRSRVHLAIDNINGYLARGLLPERSRKQVERILAKAMPRWLDDVNGVVALESFAELIHAIAGRATWLDLLATHKGALDWLIGALSASRYIADHIVRDPSWLEWPLASERGEADVQKICSQLDALAASADVEQVLADVGRLVDRGRLVSALSIDAHVADPLTVGGWLADVADAATRALLQMSRQQLHLPDDFPFVALAMGKHGSREMGLVSDLDMVFVLVHDDREAIVAGRSAWEQAQRLGRRLIQHLTAKPPFGAGFEFDARLRPSGAGGVLVTTLAGFGDYQLHEAQTWEHQALCRARVVAGPEAPGEVVAAAVEAVLNLPRDPAQLAAEVVGMRRKMLEHLASRKESVINLKHDSGGLVDIEFLAQYARLAFGGPAHGTVEVLRRLPASAPEAWRQEAGFLAATYLDYRQMENALRVELWRSIGSLSADPAATEWETMRRHAAIHAPAGLAERMRRVHGIFQQLLQF
ncbi:MAG TPA: bifunctional [glutamate--ammonia ligase]-adenylyl-L-tyrosine phosphorylase/[glutamate--ammonia-ligase] adenylyltransferase [Mariprofundaceae bacterium]|nr:bifunctional [glutamate--ammonia ligase]-adenylyl-L-tyrosine phosphorylase/[glutamate--ammonia-ligase] adenylyltransferase [Mariprofundaceae bacterium]